MIRLALVAVVALGILLPSPIRGQSWVTWDPQGLIMVREELEVLLGRLNDVADSPGYSGRIRESARRDAELIQARLDEGDFRLGDRVRISVQGEPDIPAELPVEPGPQITIPVIGPISLRGVLRSELEPHLIRELSRFIQAPIVSAEALIRVSIQGSVTAPGFYVIPANMLVSEALMLAGGPSQAADLEGIRIERTGESLWEGDEMRMVLAEGRTLDQLNLQAGDQIVLPAVEAGNFWNSTWGAVTRWGLAVGSTVLFGVRIFGGGF
jgi:polysaccharide export outer membrane protein